jgi:geranyl-CoA carboxylase alpha subunit
VQRRFQKVIEEAPAPGLDAGLRARLLAMAVLAAQRSAYLGAGTVELLLAPDGACYFLEMNTRLQVEHPVTELVTGVDLVEQQLRIAEGRPLALAEVAVRGHAIEARLYAEDASAGFAPARGTLARLRLPESVRVDHALREGLEIGPHYDPLLAKLIAHGDDREQARARLRGALHELRVLGVPTNQALLIAVLDEPRFATGPVTTEFLEALTRDAPAPAPAPFWFACAALAFLARARARGGYPAELAALCACEGLGWPLRLRCGEHELALRVEPADRAGGLRVRAAETSLRAEALRVTGDALSAVLDGVRWRFDLAWDGARLWLQAGDTAHAFEDQTYAAAAAAEAPGSGRALAPMDGAVVEVRVREGEQVRRGQTLAVIEAMKMQLAVAADCDGTVREVKVRRGDQVKARSLLLTLEPADRARPRSA